MVPSGFGRLFFSEDDLEIWIAASDLFGYVAVVDVCLLVKGRDEHKLIFFGATTMLLIPTHTKFPLLALHQPQTTTNPRPQNDKTTMN